MKVNKLMPLLKRSSFINRFKSGQSSFVNTSPVYRAISSESDRSRTNTDLWSIVLKNPDINPLRQNFIAKANHRSKVSVEEGVLRSDLPDALLKNLTDDLSKVGVSYPGPYGVPAVLDQLASHITEKGLTVSSDQLLINYGVSDGLTRSMKSLLSGFNSPQVLTFSPFFKPQEAMIRRANRSASLVVCDNQLNEFRPSFDTLKEKITRTSRVLLLTTPHNPSGVVYNVNELISAIRFCKEHKLFLIIDATYFDMSEVNCYARLQSALDVEPFLNLAVLGTNSKLLSAAIRSGWLWTPNLDLREHIAHGVTIDMAGISTMASIATSVTINHFFTLQMGYTQTLYLKELWLQCLSELGLPLPAFCEGGLYLTIPTPSQMPGSVFTRLLHEKYDLGVVPFQFFVQDTSDDPPFIRVACVNEDSTRYAIQSYQSFF